MIGNLQRVRNSSVRLASGVGSRDSAYPLLAAFHWLPVRQHITYQIDVVAFMASHSGEPACLGQHLAYNDSDSYDRLPCRVSLHHFVLKLILIGMPLLISPRLSGAICLRMSMPAILSLPWAAYENAFF